MHLNTLKLSAQKVAKNFIVIEKAHLVASDKFDDMSNDKILKKIPKHLKTIRYNYTSP